MTRRGSRTEGRQPDQTRPAADYNTGDPPPWNCPVLTCTCGGAYRDHPDSHTAHKAVFGHRPIRETAPPSGESAPEHNQEG